MRICKTCQHVKRAEIDRRLAAGEPGNQVARDYDINPSSLHRHRTKCLGLGASNEVMKEVARGTAASVLLPTVGNLSGAYFELRERIDQIVRQAEQQGLPKVAISGLNSIRQTLDSLSRLAAQERSAQGNEASRTNTTAEMTTLSERLINAFDHEPEMKARIAQALVEMDHGDAA